MLKVDKRIRVEWAHCDPARIIYNPYYYIWMDANTHQIFDVAGFDFAKAVEGTGFRGCPVVSNEAQFRVPAFYNDVIELTSWIPNFGTKSFTVRHIFKRGEEILVEGKEVRVWGWSDPADPLKLKAVPVPNDVKESLAIKGNHDVTP